MISERVPFCADLPGPASDARISATASNGGRTGRASLVSFGARAPRARAAPLFRQRWDDLGAMPAVGAMRHRWVQLAFFERTFRPTERCPRLDITLGNQRPTPRIRASTSGEVGSDKTLSRCQRRAPCAAVERSFPQRHSSSDEGVCAAYSVEALADDQTKVSSSLKTLRPR